MIDAKRQEVQGHPQLHNESEASLGHMRPHLKQTRTKTTQEEGIVLWGGEKIGEARPGRKWHIPVGNQAWVSHQLRYFWL